MWNEDYGNSFVGEIHQENSEENGKDGVYEAYRVPEVSPKKKKHTFLKLTAGLLTAALVAGGAYTAGRANVFGGNESGRLTQTQEIAQGLIGQNNTADIPSASAMSNLIQTGNESDEKTIYTPAEIAAKYKSSVVAITSTVVSEGYNFFGQSSKQESEGAGSGIIVSGTDEELLIATNNHVVDGATKLKVCFNDNEEQTYEAYIKGTDPSNDLAVVAVKLADIPKDVLKTLTIAVIGDSDKCVLGEQVVAIGNALGYGQSLTVGYVSALNRVVTVDDVTYTLIQTDAAINPGNSGGALFNMYGEVIGINSVKFASSTIEGMGFAIPISKAVPILNELAMREVREVVAEEEQGYLGIGGTDVTSTISGYYNMPVGIYINTVEENSGADQAGMQTGDIIVKFDGMAVSTMTQLKNALQYYKAGETVEVVVKRLNNGEYEEKTLTLTLGEKAVVEKDVQKNDSAQGKEQKDSAQDDASDIPQNGVNGNANGRNDWFFGNGYNGGNGYDNWFGDFGNWGYGLPW